MTVSPPRRHGMLGALRQIFFLFLNRRRRLGESRTAAYWFVAAFMALPLAVLYEVIADLLSRFLGVPAPIDYFPKWAYLICVFSAMTFIIHEVVGKPAREIAVRQKDQREGASVLFIAFVALIWFGGPVLVYWLYFF